MQDPIMHSKIKTTASGGLFFDSVLNFESSPGLEERRLPEMDLPARFCGGGVCVLVCNWVFSVAKVFRSKECGFYSSLFIAK
jgi:hypothetical protein